MNNIDNNRPALVTFLNSDVNKRNNEQPAWMMLRSGYANGYVAIPPSHPDYKKDLQFDCDIRVHGGITFCKPYHDCLRMFKSMEFIGEQSEIKDDWWVIGFDTCHYGDSLDDCPRQYVIEQTLSLKKQLEERWK